MPNAKADKCESRQIVFCACVTKYYDSTPKTVEVTAETRIGMDRRTDRCNILRAVQWRGGYTAIVKCNGDNLISASEVY